MWQKYIQKDFWLNLQNYRSPQCFAKINNIMPINLKKSLCSVLLVLLSLMASGNSQGCPIAQYVQFVHKSIDHPLPIIPNPYLNPSVEYLERVKQNLGNKERVCALKYLDSTKKTYSIRQFDNRSEAEAQNWIVTHQGVCGKCSTTKDLYVYLTKDLTRPVRACGLAHPFSQKSLLKCIKGLGFTSACSEVWMWNTLYTKKSCGMKCIVALVLRRPFVVDDHLNKCLQCDEDKSGPIFKFESGRTRRNSGIRSEIDRPSDQIYNVTHCYY